MEATESMGLQDKTGTMGRMAVMEMKMIKKALVTAETGEMVRAWVQVQEGQVEMMLLAAVWME